MNKSVSYMVQKGDTINSIMNRFEISSWNDVYYANANRRFIASRKPNLIIPGELWIIPQSEQQILFSIYKSNLKLQVEYSKMSMDIEAGLKRDYAQFNSNILAIDITAAILTTVVSMGATGIKAAALEGQALKTANNELIKSTKKLAVDIPRNLVGSAIKIDKDNYNIDELNDERSIEVVKFLKSKLPEVGKIAEDILDGRGTIKVLKKAGYASIDVLGEVFNILTPSWFAEKWTGIRPGEEYSKALSQIVIQREKVLKDLGLKAAAIYEEISRYSRTA